MRCDLCNKEIGEEYYVEKDYKDIDEGFVFCKGCFERYFKGKGVVKINFVWGDVVYFKDPEKNFEYCGGGVVW